MGIYCDEKTDADSFVPCSPKRQSCELKEEGRKKADLSLLLGNTF